MRKLKTDGPTRQERQKQQSRESILQAARSVLAEKSYIAMAIEDVIARATVSRATFYKHFDSKFAIGRELHREFAPQLTAAYDVLLAYDDRTEAELAGLGQAGGRALPRESRPDRHLRPYAATEPAFHPIMIDIISRDGIALGKAHPGIPATGFRRARGDARSYRIAPVTEATQLFLL